MFIVPGQTHCRPCLFPERAFHLAKMFLLRICACLALVIWHGVLKASAFSSKKNLILFNLIEPVILFYLINKLWKIFTLFLSGPYIFANGDQRSKKETQTRVRNHVVITFIWKHGGDHVFIAKKTYLSSGIYQRHKNYSYTTFLSIDTIYFAKAVHKKYK